MTNATHLDDRTLLLSVEMCCFGNERKMADNAYTLNNVTPDENVRAKRLTKAKQVRLDSPLLAEIIKFDKETRATLYAITMPSGLRKGVFRITLDATDRVLALLQERAATRAQMVEAFQADYEAAIERTRTALGPLFRQRLYPRDPRRAAAEFTMEWRFVASGVPEALARVNQQAYEAEVAAWKKHMAEIEENYRIVLRESVAALVGHLADRLAPAADGKRKRLHGTVIGNISEFVKNFPFKNMAEDAELARMVARMDAMFSGLDVEILKDDDDLRAFVQAQATTFKAEVDGLVREAKTGQRQIIL